MDNLIGSLVAGKYLIEKRIGKGSFGEIYEALDRTTNKKVGVKVEVSENTYPQLEHERKIYDEIRGGPGIPYLYWYGEENNLNFLVIDLLGLSLEALFEKCGKKFSLITVLRLAEQMLSRIEYLHAEFYIHRDIKPENFVIGTEDRSSIVYIIDYGLCKKYMNWRSGKHIKFIEGKSLTGTARYVSIYTHLGYEQSRRDDLEGLAYVLIYFIKGKLPWQDLSIPDKNNRYDAIKDIKISTSEAELCQDLPPEFAQFLVYSKSLKFEENPDYYYLKGLFTNLIRKLRLENNFVYDWEVLQQNSTEIKRKETNRK